MFCFESDMAPNTTGIQTLDHGNIMRLAFTALEFSKWVLKKNGMFLVKVYEEELIEFLFIFLKDICRYRRS